MIEEGYIPKDLWKAFVNGLSEHFHVYAPCKDGDTITFGRLAGDDLPCLDQPAQSPPKGAIFPQSEILFTFNIVKEAEEPQKNKIELETPNLVGESVILCCRPCDARGFSTLDPVFLEKDPYYRERRTKTTIITLSCPHNYVGCFCTSVGCSPVDRKDSDVMITELEKGYYVEVLTEKGAAALKHTSLHESTPHKAEAERRQAFAEKQVARVFSGGKDVKLRSEIFQSEAFWEEVSAKCISCGACTYLCPTCYCFNITDEQGVRTGERIKSWDSCMFPQYTLEASGHNPRAHKAQRLRNRVGHKFLYYPELYHELLCSGCGRCIRHCPVSLDISRIVEKLAEREPEATEGASR
jgi:ferredoxin